MTAVPTRLDRHRTQLILSGRCSACAESIRPSLLLRGGTCPRCETSLNDGNVGGQQLIDGIRSRWRRWRWVAYGLVLASNIVAGLVPLLPSLLTFVGMMVCHVVLLRRSTRWLSPPRRAMTRLGLSLLIAGLTVTGLIVNIVAAGLLVFAGVGSLVSGGWALLSTAIYLELGLFWVDNRLRREASHPALAVWEWALPLGLVGALIAMNGLMLLVAWGSLHILTTVNVPLASDIASFLLDGGA